MIYGREEDRKCVNESPTVLPPEEGGLAPSSALTCLD